MTIQGPKQSTKDKSAINTFHLTRYFVTFGQFADISLTSVKFPDTAKSSKRSGHPDGHI